MASKNITSYNSNINLPRDQQIDDRIADEHQENGAQIEGIVNRGTFSQVVPLCSYQLYLVASDDLDTETETGVVQERCGGFHRAGTKVTILKNVIKTSE